MPVRAPSFREYLRRREKAINLEEPPEQEEQTRNLFNEKTFYQAFVKDMLEAEKEVIIYSPFVTKFRSVFFKQTLTKLKRRNVNVFIFTRPLEEHDLLMRSEISCALRDYEELGVCICYLEGLIHEKMAVIDREILWEGSLNILSQRKSREIMSRTSNKDTTMQIMSYLGLNKKLAENYKLQYEKLCQNLIDNSKLDSKLKIRIFLLGLAVPAIILWMIYFIKSMIFLCRFFN